MDSVQQFDFQHASASKHNYPTTQYVSPQSISDSESQLSIDSISSQESLASSATSASTLWSSVNNSQLDLSLNNRTRVEQWNSETWPQSLNYSQVGPQQVPTSATARGVRRSASVSLEEKERSYPSHRQELRAINKLQPSGYPCAAAVQAARVRAQTLSTCGVQYCSKAQSQPSCNIAVAKTQADKHVFRRHSSHVSQALPGADLSGGALYQPSSNPENQKQACVATSEHSNNSHPRRSSAVASWTKPTLVRATVRRQALVEHLVGKQKLHMLKHEQRIHSMSIYLHISKFQDSASQLVGAIWPTSMPISEDRRRSLGCPIIPLRDFIRETLKRSRTSYSTLQLTLYYLLMLQMKGNLPSCDFTKEQTEDAAQFRALQCGRRMFLAALILASKYLQDQNYSAKAWSKITGLRVHEISSNEMAFLTAVDFGLHIRGEVYESWVSVVTRCTEAPSTLQKSQRDAWRSVIEMFGRNVPIDQMSGALGPDISCQQQESMSSSPIEFNLSTTPSKPSFTKHADLAYTTSPNYETPAKPFAIPVRSAGGQTSRPFAVPPAPTLGGTLQTPQISPCNSRRGSITLASTSSRTSSWDLVSNGSMDDATCSRALNKSAAFSRWVNTCQNTPVTQLRQAVSNSIDNHGRVMASPESIVSSCESIAGTQPTSFGSIAQGLLTPATTVSSSEDESGSIRIPETPPLETLAIQDSAQSTPTKLFDGPCPVMQGPAASRIADADYHAQRRHSGMPVSKSQTLDETSRPTLGPHSRSSHDLFENVRGLLGREVQSTASLQQATSELKHAYGPAQPKADTEFMDYIESLMHPTPVSNVRDADRTPRGTPSSTKLQAGRKRGPDEVGVGIERQEKLRCLVRA